MIHIIFEAHATSHDNEKEIASGWGDTGLSSLGREQAIELGNRYENEDIDVVFASDLRRSYLTAELAFGSREGIKIIRDARLRECNYGIYNGSPSVELHALKINHIYTPFPEGESYDACMMRMKTFLDDIRQEYPHKTVLIIGHRATQYALEHFIHQRDLASLVSSRFVWQPGWTYQLI